MRWLRGGLRRTSLYLPCVRPHWTWRFRPGLRWRDWGKKTLPLNPASAILCPMDAWMRSEEFPPKMTPQEREALFKFLPSLLSCRMLPRLLYFEQQRCLSSCPHGMWIGTCGLRYFSWLELPIVIWADNPNFWFCPRVGDGCVLIGHVKPLTRGSP